MRAIAALCAIMLAALIAAMGVSSAQTDDRQSAIDGWRAALAQTEAALRRADLSLAELDGERSDVQAVLTAARALQATLAPEIADLDARLKAIAPPEGAGDTLPESIAEVRDQLQAEFQRLSNLSQQAGIIVIQAEQLLATIAQRRDAQFAARLFERDRSVLDPALWRDLAAETPAVLTGAARILSAWADRIAMASDRAAVALIVAAVAIVALLLVLRRRLMRRAVAWADAAGPTQRRKVMMATAVVAADIGVPLLILFGLRALFTGLSLLPPNVGTIWNGVIVAVAVYAIVTGMARALAAPGRPEWRIGGIADETARRACRIVDFAALFLALVPLVDHLAEVTAAAPDYAVGVAGILAVPAAILAIFAARTLVRGRDVLSEAERTRAARWRILTPIAALAAIVTLAAAGLGFLAFARFMVEQIAWVWVVAGVYVIASGLLDEAIAVLLSTGGRGLQLGRMLGLSDPTVERLGILLAGIARIVLFLLAVLVILAPWGISSANVIARLEALYYGVQIGSIRITFSTVLFALLVFVAVIVASRIFQRWLENRFLPTTSIDPGLKNSIHTAAGYIGIVLAVLLAAAYAGLDLANIALIAGALSVGIGFGLQSVVNNFVSGLILLAERPIRAGDWIQVGTDEGTVKRISVRATEIETFDRASVIIPNSNLISGVVKNWYLRDNSGRTMVTVGVGYECDPEQVKAILLDIADKHELVLKVPKPFVAFSEFGDSALIFQLYVYLASISNGLTVRSDLRFAIFARLREAGISIPFPQRDINLRDWPRIEEAIRGGDGRGSDGGGKA